MTTKKQQKEQAERMRLPGEEPTDEDLRTDAELTRQELGETVAALGERLDVKTRVRTATKQRAEAVKQRAEAVRDTMRHRPVIPVGAIAVLIATLLIWLKIHRRPSRSSGRLMPPTSSTPATSFVRPLRGTRPALPNMRRLSGPARPGPRGPRGGRR